MKKLETYKKFLKVVRKYYKKKLKNSKNSIWTIYWEYIADTKEKIEEIRRHKKYLTPNLDLITNEVLRDLGKEVIFDRLEKGIGILSGISITEEDYYYVVDYPEGRQFITCCGGYTLARS